MKLTDEEKSRLTKKAQNYIEFLELEMDIAQRQVNELNGILYTQEVSGISFYRGFRDDATGIPEGSAVAFKMRPSEHKREDTIEVRVSNGALRISGDTQLVISPTASNVVRVSLSES